MATRRDAEYNQMSLKIPLSSSPLASQSARRGTQIAEQRMEVQVTVHRAINVPSIQKYFLKRNLFVAVSNSETTAKTKDVPVKGQMANWNQNLDPFLVQPSSRLTSCLCEAVYTSRHPFRHPSDADTPSLSKCLSLFGVPGSATGHA